MVIGDSTHVVWPEHFQIYQEGTCRSRFSETKLCDANVRPAVPRGTTRRRQSPMVTTRRRESRLRWEMTCAVVTQVYPCVRGDDVAGCYTALRSRFLSGEDACGCVARFNLWVSGATRAVGTRGDNALACRRLPFQIFASDFRGPVGFPSP
jgi:hypothetical protein